MALAEALRTVRYGGAVAASGLTGGNDLATTVYPFIVRGVALLGIDTVATPIEERRALWADMADAFPLEHCEEMVNEEIGLSGLTAALDRVLDARGPRPDPGRPRPLTSRLCVRKLGVHGRDPDGPVAAGGDGQRKESARTWLRRAVVTAAVSEVGQLVSLPVGTSEYW